MEGFIWILYDNRNMIDCFKSVDNIMNDSRFIKSECPYSKNTLEQMLNGDLLMWNKTKWIIECHKLK